MSSTKAFLKALCVMSVLMVSMWPLDAATSTIINKNILPPEGDGPAFEWGVIWLAKMCKIRKDQFCKIKIVGIAASNYKGMTDLGPGSHWKKVNDSYPLLSEWVTKLNAFKAGSPITADIIDIMGKVIDVLKDAVAEKTGKRSHPTAGIFVALDILTDNVNGDAPMTEDQYLTIDHETNAQLEADRITYSMTIYALQQMNVGASDSSQKENNSTIMRAKALLQAIHSEEVHRHMVSASSNPMFPPAGTKGRVEGDGGGVGQPSRGGGLPGSCDDPSCGTGVGAGPGGINGGIGGGSTSPGQSDGINEGTTVPVGPLH